MLVQAGLCWTWSETLKTVFLVSQAHSSYKLCHLPSVVSFTISYRISPFVIYEAIRSYMCVFEDKKHHGKKKDQASQTVPVEGQKGGKRELLNEAAGGEPSKKKKKKKKRKVSLTGNVVKHLLIYNVFRAP